MSLSYLPLTDGLYQYLVEQRSEVDDPVLAALRAETLKLGEISRMAISPDQAALLTLLTGIMGVRRAVEVGTFTGSSSISIARGLAPGGKLICFDQDFKWTSIARRYWFTAGLQDRIELKLGNARDLLKRFRPSMPLDLVFIDADKESYDLYYELLLPLVRPGGLIIFDNMLNGGKVVDPAERNSPVTKAIDTMNRKLAIDPRVQAVLIPVADGLQLCRKW
jgi:caffeoyl-CoA O-methyltransferase